MKKLQLFGRSKYFSLASSDVHKKAAKTKVDEDIGRDDQVAELTNKLCILDLPPSIQAKIWSELSIRDLINVCRVNKQLYATISNDYLYKDVILDSKISLLKFNAAIHSEFHTANALRKNGKSKNARFLVRSIEFRNPECQDSLLKYSKFYSGGQDSSSIIGGSYNINSVLTDSSVGKLENKYIQYTYIELMLDIIDYLPNLSHIILSDIEPGFKIPYWYSVFNDGSRDFFKKIIKGQQSMNNNDLRSFQISDKFVDDYERKFYTLQRFKTLELRGVLDPKKQTLQVPLRSNLLCCFGVINELVLENIIIDPVSLDTPLEFIPMHLEKNRDSTGATEPYSVHSTYQSLTLKSCQIIPGNGILRLFNEFFQCVRTFNLLSIWSIYDLLLCNCFPKLTDLTIDCNSRCFRNQIVVNENYYYDENKLNFDDLDLDNVSMSETLLDDPDEQILQAPPPTTAVVLALELNYITRTTTDTTNKRRPAMITKEQALYFQHSRIPHFHYFFHYFKSLWERLPHKNVNINIVNIPFTNVFPLSPLKYWEKLINQDSSDQETLIAYRNSARSNDENDASQNSPCYYWNQLIENCIKDGVDILRLNSNYADLSIEDVLSDINSDTFNNYQNVKRFKDIPNINLYFFLKSLSRFKSVKIQMLRKWAFCTTRSRYDWELLLKPVLNVNVPIEVHDKDGFTLYSYGKNNLH